MKQILFKILRFSGIPYLVRENFQRNKITIFSFHDPTVVTFEVFIRYLKKHYEIISLKNFNEYLNGKRSIPQKSIVITIDDGHKNNFKLLKVINSNKIPVTIFLCSDIVNTNRHFWWTHEIDGYSLKQLKNLSEVARRNLYKNNGFSYSMDFGEENRQAFNMEELFEMSQLGYVDFQSHTMSHVLLPTCDDSLSFKEINYSKIDLQKKLNNNIFALAYPNGAYTEREIFNAKKAGYECAVTTEPGFNNLNTDPFRLKRLGIRDEASLDEIVVRTSGLWGFFKKLKKLILPSTID